MNSDEKMDWLSYIDAMSAVHHLQLDAERCAAVLQQMTIIESLARRFVDFPLEPEVEIAPVFRP